MNVNQRSERILLFCLPLVCWAIIADQIEDRERHCLRYNFRNLVQCESKYLHVAVETSYCSLDLILNPPNDRHKQERLLQNNNLTKLNTFTEKHKYDNAITVNNLQFNYVKKWFRIYNKLLPFGSFELHYCHLWSKYPTTLK